MKLLITGAAGKVAAGVIRTLGQYHELRLLDVARSDKFPEYEWVEGSILDSTVLQQALVDVEGVINLAVVRDVDSETIFDVNVKGLYLLLEAAQAAGVKRMVQVSSTAVVIGHWESGEPISVDSPYTTRGRYSLTKALQEMVCEHVANNSDLQIVVVRPWYPYDRTVMPETPDYFPGLLDSEEFGLACHLALTQENLGHFERFHVVATPEAQARFDASRTAAILGFKPQIFTDLYPNQTEAP